MNGCENNRESRNPIKNNFQVPKSIITKHSLRFFCCLEKNEKIFNTKNNNNKEKIVLKFSFIRLEFWIFSQSEVGGKTVPISKQKDMYRIQKEK